MEAMGLKALVTGGTGFIGSNLIRELVKRDWEVYALVRKNSSLGYKRLHGVKNINYIFAEDLFKESNEEVAEADLVSYADLKSIPTFDVCFNLAAYGVDYNQQDSKKLIDGNIGFTMDLLEFCKKNKTKKVINTGSCFEYGLNEGKRLSEDDKINPQALYGAAKACNVIMANTFSRKNDIPLITVRPFGIFGENEGIHKFVPQLMNSIIKEEPMEMTNGDQVRDYLYIEDLIDAYITLAIADVPLYESYNICSGQEVRIKDLAVKLSEVTGCSLELFKFGSIPYRKNEVMHFVGDNSKINRYTNWKPNFTLEEGLKRTYEWYKENLEDIL